MLQRWLEKNKNLKDKELADAVAKQPWDPSVQALAGLPEVVKRLGDDIQWTADLGNAFLAQQSDVMDAVQRMRKKAQEKGTLKSTEQQKVETKVVENKSVIVIEQANPQVVYVPSYNPVVVYGPAYYPYPPIYYPPWGYYAAGMAISFGVGVVMGAFWGGGWGWGCGWGGNNIYINVNNNFNRNTNISGGNRTNIGGGNRTNIGGGGDRTNGHTIRNIAAAPRIGTGLPRTGLGAVRAVIRLPNAKPVPSNELAGRAGIWPATVARRRLRQSGRWRRRRRPRRGTGGVRFWQRVRNRRSRSHRQPGSFAQRWRKPGCLRRRFQGIQRIERAQQQQSWLLQHVISRRRRVQWRRWFVAEAAGAGRRLDRRKRITGALI